MTNYLEMAKQALARQPRELTNEQSFKLIVTDAWLKEIDDFLDRRRQGIIVYRPLSPLWGGQEVGEHYSPDELLDPLRKAG